MQCSLTALAAVYFILLLMVWSPPLGGASWCGLLKMCGRVWFWEQCDAPAVQRPIDWWIHCLAALTWGNDGKYDFLFLLKTFACLGDQRWWVMQVIARPAPPSNSRKFPSWVDQTRAGCAVTIEGVETTAHYQVMGRVDALLLWLCIYLGKRLWQTVRLFETCHRVRVKQGIRCLPLLPLLLLIFSKFRFLFAGIYMIIWQSIWSKLASWSYSGITLDIKVFSLWRTS